MLVVSGLAVLAWVIVKSPSAAHIETAMPVQALLAIVALVTGVAWLIKGPLRMFDAPAVLAVAMVGMSYGAVGCGVCLAFPKSVPKPVQALFGTLGVVGGVLLLLLQLRVIKPM
jgi:hypothetical protein